MGLAPLTPWQEAVATALRRWCDAEGTDQDGQLILQPATPVHPARSLIQLTLGDTILWIADDGVTVGMPQRRVEIARDAHASCAQIVGAVIEVLVSG